MKKQWIHLIWGFILPIFLVSCSRAKGFTLKKIISYHNNDPRWENSSFNVDEETQLRKIFLKPFTYLGSGNHCYAFKSQNEEFVLKFFKQNLMRIHPFIHHLPTSTKQLLYRTKKYAEKIEQREKSFNSYKIAYEHLKKETGIFYLHLNKTNHLNQIVTLIDQHGNPIKVDIDKMEFLVQKKAKVGYERLHELFSAGKREEAFESILSLISIISKRMEKGFLDQDLQFFKNFGFIENQAIEIDIGELQPNIPQNKNNSQIKEIREMSHQLIEWVSTYYPEYHSDVEQLINDRLNQIGELKDEKAQFYYL